MTTTIKFQTFFLSKSLNIISMEEVPAQRNIKLKSISHSSTCNKCGRETKAYHGTYIRRVQDLPILGKSTFLDITAHEYTCTHSECDAKTVVEDLDVFLCYYSRMTERLADFICTLVLETSCEACARICKTMGIHTSGDSILRLLIKRYEKQPKNKCGSVIGIDDFSYKKKTYL